MSKRNKNRRRQSVLLAAQTVYHLENWARLHGHRDIGRVIDKLTRDRALALREWPRYEKR